MRLYTVVSIKAGQSGFTKILPFLTKVKQGKKPETKKQTYIKAYYLYLY